MLSKAVPVFLILLSVSSLWRSSECALFKRPSKDDRRFQRPNALSMEEIHKELNRVRRAAPNGDPTYKKSLLNDTSDQGLVQYAGNDSKVIYVLTAQFGGSIASTNVYLSNDYGYTFKNITMAVSDGATLDFNIFLSPEDSKRVYFADANEAAIYISNDEGATFSKRSFTPNTIDPSSLLLHPTIEDWVLARDNNDNLYVSRNFGRKAFTKIAENVNSPFDYQWGHYPYDSDASLIYYNTDSKSSTNSEVDLYTQHYPYDDSSRKEFDPSLGAHDGFLMVDRYIFAQKTIDGVATLWVSADRQPFKQAKIPSNYGHLNYIVDSIRSIQALVIVQHDNGQFNLYMSEEQGVLYNLALDDISVLIGSGFIAIDLEVVASMNYTTYVANQYVRSDLISNPTTRTLISYDAGGNWELLTPPTTSDTECIQPLCSLHLHMSTSEYWRTGVYSQESAPGIILAHGVLGASLDPTATEVDTSLFISRDGGSTWDKTLDDTWGVAVLDLGGLIVAAKDYHNGVDESRTLKYSCDEGMTWSDLTFTNDNLRVFAVITEPGQATTVASLYGIQVDVDSWVVVTIDFANIFPKDCESSDYYGWTPFDDNTDTGCLLGASVTVERHKPSVCCRNGKSYERVTSYSVCECSAEDFECDYGYKHANGYSGSCVRDEEISLDPPCGGGDLTYTQSQGYHKIGGDVCSGGVESSYTAVKMPCCYSNGGSGSSSSSSSSSSTTTSVVLGVFVIIALIVIGVFAAILIVFIIKYLRKGRGHTGGYRVAPTYEPEQENVGVQNINYEEDDARPLTP